MRPHDRRRHPRVPAEALTFLSAQLSDGAALALVDVSHRGVRLETSRHMRPGQTVSVRFAVASEMVAVNAAVVRATVTRLEADSVRYETALHLVDDSTSERFQVALVAQRRADHEATAPPATPLPPGLEVVLVGENTPQDDGAPEPAGRYGWWLSGDGRRKRRRA